jgi:hypothetical protein
VRITLSGGADAEAVLVLEGITHLGMDGSGSWDDFVDDLTAIRLPTTGPWPERVRHLWHCQDGRGGLAWLRLAGPTAVGALGRRLTVVGP